MHIKDWIAWTANPEQAINPRRALNERLEQPVLPRLLRRRLNAVGRAACEAVGLLDDGNGQPLIHASRHGDVSSSLTMLQAINSGTPVSPASFSTSVHNAVLGIYTIASQHHGPTLALSACGHEFDALINEARGYLAAGQDSVIALFSEGDIPQQYQPFTESPAHPCMIALKLTSHTGWRLDSAAAFAKMRPTPLDIINWLSHNDAQINPLDSYELERA